MEALLCDYEIHFTDFVVVWARLCPGRANSAQRRNRAEPQAWLAEDAFEALRYCARYATACQRQRHVLHLNDVGRSERTPRSDGMVPLRCPKSTRLRSKG